MLEEFSKNEIIQVAMFTIINRAIIQVNNHRSVISRFTEAKNPVHNNCLYYCESELGLTFMQKKAVFRVKIVPRFSNLQNLVLFLWTGC